MQFLPSDVRQAIIRSQIHIESEGLEGVKFKIATTQDEIEQGFRLLYECYLSDGIINKNESQLRVTKYHLLPTSSMVIAIRNNEVIATVTHVMDSSMGLPCESQCDLKELRKPPNIVAEISALAIKKSYRREYSILFGLTRFLYNYSSSQCGVSYWVIVIRKRVQEYYRAIFFFQSLSETEFTYHFANGLQSVALKADLKGLVGLFENHYKELPKEKNLYDFYLNDDRELVEIAPDFIFKTSTLPVFNLEMLDYFFNKKSDVLSQLTDKEKREILNAYCNEDYESIFASHLPLVKNRRLSPRRTVNMKGFLVLADGLINQIIDVSILNISRGGLLLFSRQGLPDVAELELLVEIVLNQSIAVKIHSLVELPDSKFACRIIEERNPAWVQFADAVENHLKEFRLKQLGSAGRGNDV